jgi:hypothetical protein
VIDLWPLLKDISQVILCGDGDGRFGAARCAWVAYPEDCKDLNDVLHLKGATTTGDVLRAAKPYPIKGLYKISDYPDIAEPITCETGFINLNPHFRLGRGEFIPITGVPGHGKSRFALALLASLAIRHKQRSAIASFEIRIAPYVRDVLREHFVGKAAKDLTLSDKQRADAWIEDMLSSTTRTRARRKRTRQLNGPSSERRCRRSVWYRLASSRSMEPGRAQAGTQRRRS